MPKKGLKLEKRKYGKVGREGGLRKSTLFLSEKYEQGGWRLQKEWIGIMG